MKSITDTINISLVNYHEYAEQIKFIRSKIFIEEQKIPSELEWDDQDDNALHFLVFSTTNSVIAYARLLNSGKLGRVAVLKQWRKQGVGSLLISYIIQNISYQSQQSIHLSAQKTSIPFYLKLGFELDSEPFIEAGIEHVNMIKTI